MSIEYSATLPKTLQPEVAGRILEAIAKHPSWKVVNATQTTVRLRSANREPRESWPEDLAVSVDAAGLDVSFDSATRDERRDFLSFLTELLQSHGIEAHFEEV